MGKQGPCYHCGVTSTPLWRNGPPDKPILCNACGSRWRTKGTLVNYTPLHARSEPDEFEDLRVSKIKAISIKNKEAKLLKRKDKYENLVAGGSSSCLLGGGSGSGGGWFAPAHHNQSLFKGLDEDTSNRSSSGSAISNSDGCMQLCSADASDLTGPSQSSIVWDRDRDRDRDTTVPSRKRTCVMRPKQSSVEKLTRDLYTILHEQRSYFSGSSEEEEDLIFESDTPMVSVEIGHGSVLIRHPNTNTNTQPREEESEASSLSFDTKHQYNNRDNDGKLLILTDHNSPLCYMDLKDIINFDVFASHMTNDEQQQLVKYLPTIDNAQLPNSLKSMFDSPEFVENLFSFQTLLAEGNFDLSDPAMKNEGCTTLYKLALSNLTKCKWLEQYNLLQDPKYKKDSRGCVVTQVDDAIVPGRWVNVHRSSSITQSQSQSQSHSFIGWKSRKEVVVVDTDGSGFSPRSLFALPPDNSSLMLDYCRYADEQDVLLDVPSHTAFPQAQAQLLSATSTFVATASTSPNP